MAKPAERVNTSVLRIASCQLESVGCAKALNANCVNLAIWDDFFGFVGRDGWRAGGDHSPGSAIGRPKWRFCVSFGSVPASGLEPDVGRNEAATVPEVPGLCRTTGPKRFAEILDDEAGRAECPDQVLPPMQIFDGSLLAIGLVGHFGQWAFVVVLDGDHVPVASISVRDLQAGRLLVLTHVESAIAEHACDLGENRVERGDIAGADRLVDDVEGLIPQGREIVHRCLDHLDGQTSSLGFTDIDGEHLVAEINDGDTCAGSGVKDRLPAPSRRQAQDVQVLNGCRQPAPTVKHLKWLGDLLVAGHAGELAALLDHPVPRRLVVTQKVGFWGRHGEAVGKSVGGVADESSGPGDQVAIAASGVSQKVETSGDQAELGEAESSGFVEIGQVRDG